MWVFNVFLYLTWLFAPAIYDAKVASGEPCYVFVQQLGDGSDPGPMPVCWYAPAPVQAPRPAGAHRAR